MVEIELTPPPSTTTDVYYELINTIRDGDTQNTPRSPNISVLALVTYAIFERDRIAAEEKQLKSNGKNLNLNEFIALYQFNEAKLEAKQILFDRYEISKISNETSNIFREIKQDHRFFPNFFKEIFIGIVSNIAFVLLVFFGWIVFKIDPSPFDLLKKALSQ
ncbi:hypothetical protein GCM10011611_40840 [Aliidongia dinghuensis]|uniref:Uncharacterized protein n=1 Tax=Aliidongia dinghuensis TaxID=1867774 RepID=A0A8J2YX75_9PROT|nr:DUF334 domain-containing protein [Aliidongia dinghuensis]GGF30564.1 hypothetical protein GCM10011611_40840 [Aliidongia dinghuensis]